jgi:hypothetical protein
VNLSPGYKLATLHNEKSVAYFVVHINFLMVSINPKDFRRMVVLNEIELLLLELGLESRLEADISGLGDCSTICSIFGLFTTKVLPRVSVFVGLMTFCFSLCSIFSSSVLASK